MKNLAKKVVKFNGGLGNQMFQYAFGCALSNKFGVDVLFDFSFFEDVKLCEDVTLRTFELDVFNLECKPVTKEDLAKVKSPDFDLKLNRTLVKRFPKFFGINYIREKNKFCFEPKLINSPDYYYYEGYFQNEKYFRHLRSELIKKFTLKVPPDKKNMEVLKKIHETNSVSIHIRRGDYVELECASKFHGTCSLRYYQDAVDYISKRIESPHFFIFSDDIDWVVKNLKIEHPCTFINFNQSKGWLDFNLMKNCKHNIIANSSFSWWSAWLNENSDNIIIAPSKWFSDSLGLRSENIVLERWVRI